MHSLMHSSTRCSTGSILEAEIFGFDLSKSSVGSIFQRRFLLGDFQQGLRDFYAVKRVPGTKCWEMYRLNLTCL